MKKILGLDLGSASIGWALISENNKNERPDYKILGLGSRIIPYEGTEGKDFVKGTGESRNSIRTHARTVRKGYDRYQLRRKNLVDTLVNQHMYPDEVLKSLPKMQLWELRNRAVDSEVSLPELGRLLLWLNQKRGYKSSRSDSNLNKKDTDYVFAVKSRHEMIREFNLTIGQYFYQQLRKDEFFRVKENLFPREAYIEEFDAICKNQQKFHSAILKDELIDKLRNEIIYFQRPLKSQKGLVSVCEFEGFLSIGKNGKEYFVGPKVTPKSCPLFQLSKIWENINNIKIGSRTGGDVKITTEQKWALFQHLDNNDRLTPVDLMKILNLKKDECYINKQLSKGLQGNITKQFIKKCFDGFGGYEDILRLDLKIITTEEKGFLYDRKTGEIINSKPIKYINPIIEQEPLYQLWHTIYSINDHNECCKALRSRFNLENEIAEKLAGIDFSKLGFGNKSSKVIRNILPYLMEGDNYSEAMCYAGYDHSNSLTKDENLKRQLLSQLKPIEKNSLRQPIVEKILNQMVNVVNAIIDKYGKPDEIRVELARELKQSKEERNETDKLMSKRQRENELISERLAEFNLRATRNNIIKWRLYEEIDNEDKKLNAICVYCGQPISLIDAIKGYDVDIEHIIPKSKLFDDSQSNKTLAHCHCNKDKNDRTAYDFMKSKSEQVFNEYVDRVNLLYYKRIIGKAKRDKLLMPESKIPSDFIDRQLRESQYIAKKAREILQSICHHVWATSGTVTSELRHLWGWDDITMNLQIDKYRALGQTHMVQWESEQGKNKHEKEVITGWTKRDDHRHHAIDALTIACTKQGYIQRFNTLNASKTREDMKFEVERRSISFKEKLSLLDKFIIGEQPFSVNDVERAVANILVSIKSGKKVAVWGKRMTGKRGEKKVIQDGILIPRGALSEEFVYGKIKMLEMDKPLKYLFENPHLIFKFSIKNSIEERLLKYQGDVKKALSSLKNDPIYLNKEKNTLLEHATCFKDEYVIKYPVNTDFNKVDKVIDGKIKDILKARLEKFGGKAKEAFRDVEYEDKTYKKWYEDEGLVYPIKSVRCKTGLSAVVPVKKDEQRKDIGFVKPGNNHHIAIYRDEQSKMVEHICSFWHAVERKKYGMPVIIQNPDKVWNEIEMKPEDFYPESYLEKLPPVKCQLLLSMQQNEMFILGIENKEFEDLLLEKDYSTLSKYLYVVWSLSEGDYWFRHHLETKNSELKSIEGAKESKRYYRYKSLGAFQKMNPIKVRIDHLGELKVEDNKNGAKEFASNKSLIEKALL